jgi:acetyl esterase
MTETHRPQAASDLDRRAKMFLAWLRLSGWPPMHERSVAQARREYRILHATMNSWQSVNSIRDTIVQTAERGVPVRVYRPRRDRGPHPIVVWFHGGGFVVGDLFSADGTCRRLANLTGATVVSVHYRRAPEHPVPAAHHDALAATRWALRHANELGADPARLVVAGDSAGGGLAAHVAQQLRDSGPIRAALQVLFYPGTDFSLDHADHDPALAKLLTWETIDWFARYSMPAGVDRRDPAISPQYANDLSRLPPAVVVTAGVDPFRADAIAYCRRLTDAGVPVTHWDYPGQIHGFVGMDRLFPAGRDAIRQSARAIAQVTPVEGAPAIAAFGEPIEWSPRNTQVRRQLREMSERLPQVNSAHVLGTVVDYRVRAVAAAVADVTPATGITGYNNPRRKW